ncbi:MAG TPA: DUF1156 domain-containing protein [Kofleriaceae bacterium]|nr:DUF1156 domain-containing protein [Kofleriaceae bacterium]
MTSQVRSPRKLIEVALPLDAINEACSREKSIRHGHPSTLHLWWARRPLAAARAVIFAQMVNDPGFQQGGGFRYGRNKREAAAERERLFKIIEDLVRWESTTNEEVLEQARAEIWRSWREVCELNKGHPQASELFNPDRLPGLHDPFAGGGAIPLEAQRLGLVAHATDLNPVAVLINKAMVELPRRFAGRTPVGPIVQKSGATEELRLSKSSLGATGLAEDVRRYGAWLRNEAEKRIGHLYPKVEITRAMVEARPDLKRYEGQKVVVVAWIWVRTVRSPNPAFADVEVPLASSFVLSPMSGKEAYVEPIVENGRYRFAVKIGKSADPEVTKNGTKLSRGANFRCLMSDTPISPAYIKSEGKARRMGERLMAVVVEGDNGRLYLEPTEAIESVAREATPTWLPETPLPNDPRNFWTLNYGLDRFCDLFTPRQLVALTTFADLVNEARAKVMRDALAAGMADDPAAPDGASAYADAVATYLAFLVGKLADKGSSLCTWNAGPTSSRTASGRSAAVATVRSTFGRQALQMSWDFAEVNFFSDSTGSIDTVLQTLSVPLNLFPITGSIGDARQEDAVSAAGIPNSIISTDPPYYDNIGYADLSDFFYIWLRRSLRSVFPELFRTLAVPKAEELVANPYRHGSKDNAEEFFLEGMTKAMRRLADHTHPAFPITIYYAFKQSENEDEAGTSSTGWETFLDAVIRSSLTICGTWPMRTERGARAIGIGSNALASSIVLVCRRRPPDAPSISRREFQRELNAALPEALDEMTRGTDNERSPVAPVDLSQAIIGPGMAIFSKYTAVLEADGTPMSVRTALQLINRFLAEDDFDADTQFCLRWFEQHGWKAGKFGEADTLARAKGTSVDGVRTAGVLESGGGDVRLLTWGEYDRAWDPASDTRNPVWETLHHLIRALKQDGESGAGRLLANVRVHAEPARQLAYRLYTLCERKSWPEDARVYNEIITSWSGIEASAGTGSVEPVQGKLFD